MDVPHDCSTNYFDDVLRAIRAKARRERIVIDRYIIVPVGVAIDQEYGGGNEQ